MQIRTVLAAAFVSSIAAGVAAVQTPLSIDSVDTIKPSRRAVAEPIDAIPQPPPVKHPIHVAVHSEGPYALTLGEMRFDPAREVPPVNIAWAASDPDELGRDLRLVQFVGPIQRIWLDDLEATGTEIVQYIHPYTYIVWGEQQPTRNMVDPTVVRWSGSFIPAYRVLPWYRDLGRAAQKVRIMLYRGADVDDAIRQIQQLGGVLTDHARMDQTFDIARFTLRGDLFAAAARIAGVYSIKSMPTDGGLRGEMTNQINAGNYDGSNAVFPGYMSWLSGIGLDGSGVIIANVDGGVDENHPDLEHRMVPCVGDSCSTSSSFHGTHTAGIMAADGTSETLDEFGFLRGLGVAPGANLVNQQYSPMFMESDGMLKLMTDSYNNGASLSGNSWGPSGSPLGYDDDTRQVDVGVRDADPDAAGNQSLSFVLSFMNGGGGTSTQGTPDEAKNIFNIGSTKGQDAEGSQILDINDLSSNTAHGPALDGRTIPHMVAPGCRVDSTGTGSGYGLACGTSMASPHVSGAVALFIQHYRNITEDLTGTAVDPSPALIKAAFLPVAHDLAGNRDANGNTLGHRFDSKQGWGRMNLPAVLEANPFGVQYIDNPVIFENTSEEWTASFSPLDPNEPMRIMLVWTDAPGHGLGGSTPAWNNDLDLIVEADGQTYYGNNFGAGGWSVPGGDPDDRNNTEGVILGPTAPGSVSVTVRAANINSDGVPNFGSTTDQDFALVVYNAAQEPTFLLSAASAISHAVCAPSMHSFDLNVLSLLDFDDLVTLSVSVDPSGLNAEVAPTTVIPPGPASVSMRIMGNEPPGTYAITVTGTSGDTVRQLTFYITVSTQPPGDPTLASPSNGATDVGLAPTLIWNPASQAAQYEVQLSDDPDFSNIVFEATTEAESIAVDPPLGALTDHYWRVRAINACGDGEFSEIFTFTTLDSPPFLLVDDDDNSPDVSGYYTDALNGLGYDFDMFVIGISNNDPTYAQLSQYDFIIWYTGDKFGGTAGPSAAGEAALAQYLDNGGCLFISSQDYHWDRGLTSFMTNYLGVQSVANDTTQTEVTGQAPVYGSIGTLNLSYPFANYSDTVVVGPDAQGAFDGNQGMAAVNKDGDGYRTTFLLFPLEAVSSASAREAILATFINWCNNQGEPCPGDATGDGVVDVQDLLVVIANWGTDGSGGGDLNNDGIVDVQDLLEVIANWGSICGD